MSVENLSGIRDRMLPMMDVASARYANRVPAGYPHVIDNAQQGMFGFEIDPSHALYIVSDGNELHAEVYRRSPRIDNRNSASREKFAGAPFNDRRPLPHDVDDETLRNLIAELMSYFNQQQGLLYITDD